MLLAFVLLLAGVAVGLLRGGSLENINRVRFRLPWLVFLGLGLQIGIELAAARFSGIQKGVIGPVVLAISYGCVGAFVVLNFRFPGALLIGLGLVLNLTVILANGAMPVSVWAAKKAGLATPAPQLQNSVKHREMGPSTRLGFLGDIIPVPPLGIVSAGDVVLGTGVFLLVSYLMAPPDRHRNGRKRRIRRRSRPKGVEGGSGRRHRRPNVPEPPACSSNPG